VTATAGMPTGPATNGVPVVEVEDLIREFDFTEVEGV